MNGQERRELVKEVAEKLGYSLGETEKFILELLTFNNGHEEREVVENALNANSICYDEREHEPETA